MSTLNIAVDYSNSDKYKPVTVHGLSENKELIIAQGDDVITISQLQVQTLLANLPHLTDWS